MLESETKSLKRAGEANPELYSAFTRAEKFCIVALVSFAAWFSTLSSFIYYPALQPFSEDLSVSVDDINLTITTYMSVATVAPTLCIYNIITLAVCIAANIATAASRSFHALLGLRVLQALAISGAFSIAYGVITDIASSAARGSFASAVSFAITIAPSIGPILGGCLTYARNWTWIFWFLATAAGTCLILMASFLPEITRSIVGNGSIAPPKFLRLPFGSLMRYWRDDDSFIARRRRVPNPFKSLLILTYKDNAIVIVACGLLYAVYTSLNASLSVLCIEIYDLSQWQADLIYLPFSLGGTVSTFFSTPLLDDAYRAAREKRGLDTDKATGDDLDNFPIEKARLSVMWIPMILTAASVGKVCGLTSRFSVMQLDFSIYNTLLVDKNYRNLSAAQASSNIVRCTFGAIIVAFLQDCIKSLGIGGTFTLMGGLCVVATLLFVIDFTKGTTWRQNRRTSRLAKL
ncbi:multidrug resistance protein [Xylaria sp. FL1042]|nr:multidrug resistance protein [Xylaria sp. FL1042]